MVGVFSNFSAAFCWSTPPPPPPIPSLPQPYLPPSRFRRICEFATVLYVNRFGAIMLQISFSSKSICMLINVLLYSGVYKYCSQILHFIFCTHLNSRHHLSLFVLLIQLLTSFLFFSKYQCSVFLCISVMFSFSSRQSSNFLVFASVDSGLGL